MNDAVIGSMVVCSSNRTVYGSFEKFDSVIYVAKPDDIVFAIGCHW